MTVAVDSNQDENQDATNESTSTAFMPPKPKFGGLTQVSSETWVPWTGGKPNSFYTELEDPDPREQQQGDHDPTSEILDHPARTRTELPPEAVHSTTSDPLVCEHGGR